MKELTSYQEAALDYSRHISLTANAGSGKTFVLSKRFVEIALRESIPLSSIVAITFTDKAAGELNRKIALEIEERIKSEKNPGLVRKLERLRSRIVFANISTIHSFCINILKEFSPEAGIDANFIPIDKNASNELIDLSIQEALNEGFKENAKSEELKYLIRFFGSKDNFVKELKGVIEHRRKLIRLYERAYSGSKDDIEKFYSDNFTSDFTLIFNNRIAEALINVSRINEYVFSHDAQNTKAVEIRSILNEGKKNEDIFISLNRIKRIFIHLLTKNLTVFKKDYLSDKEGIFSSEVSMIENLAADLKYLEEEMDERASKELACFAKVFSDFFIGLNEKYETRKRQKGYLDFEDILLKTSSILKLEAIKKYLEAKYKYLMVDEYQDTDEIQYEIIMPILDNLHAGNLCIVGDEKQSIYMFRDADLEVFSRTKEDISNFGSAKGILTLPHSFRLAPKIALFINHIFKKLFADPVAAFNEVNHSDLFCARSDDSEGRVEFLLCEKDTQENEAELVARKIILLYNEKSVITNFSDVMILCRKRDSFKKLEKVFVKHNIPFAVAAGKGFFQKQTTLDVFNYLSFLLNKENDAALAAILRGPFYSFSDTELFAISLEEGVSFYDKFSIYAKSNPNAEKAIRLLNLHLTEVNSYTFSALIRKILTDTFYWAVISNRRDAQQEIANLEKLIANARKFSLLGYKTLYDYIEYLKESVELLEDEGQAELTDNKDSVKIMTIHQAKGLESRAVFIFNANEKEKDNSIKAKSVVIDKKYGIVAKTPIENNYFENYAIPPITGFFNYIIKKKNEAEAKRLLYVALTRSIDYLCVSATHSDYKFMKGSFADSLFNAAGITEDKDEIIIEDDLIYLIKGKAGFEKSNRKEMIKIPVIRNIELQNFEKPSPDKFPEGLEVKTDIIPAKEKNEFVSASKISVFTQCPFKYYLTYEIGFSKLYRKLKIYNEGYEFNRKEDEDVSVMADIRGLIIHSLFEKEIKPEDADKFIEEMIRQKTATDISNKRDYSRIKDSILTDAANYYSSDTYKKLISYSRYRNEFEVYTSEEDYFLYGIVDKIIYDNDRIIIVDYKTDSISKDEINQRAESYFTQLKFYAYTLSRNLNKKYEFETKLIFIKHPDEIVTRIYSVAELDIYKNELNEIVTSIRNGNFIQNKSHCPYCHLRDKNNNCVKNENNDLF